MTAAVTLRQWWTANRQRHDDRDEDVAAAHRLDGAGNRLFLDPVLHGEYSADMLEHYAPSTGTWIRSGSRWTCRD